MKSAIIRFAILVILFLALSVGATLAAQESNRAALVISLGDGQVITRCVQFTEEQISGYDLLSRSQLAVETYVLGPGAGICRIEETGCQASDCFCECKGGGPCLYWSYWHQRNGEWVYSNVGAHLYQIGNRDVEGWVWDVGLPNEASPPPELSFEDVCSTVQDTAGEAEMALSGADKPVSTAVSETSSTPESSAQAVSSQIDVRGDVESGNVPTATWIAILAAILLLLGLVVFIWARSGRDNG